MGGWQGRATRGFAWVSLSEGVCNLLASGVCKLTHLAGSVGPPQVCGTKADNYASWLEQLCE
jgi:hypothetical protein